eukprot:sb/3461936/
MFAWDQGTPYDKLCYEQRGPPPPPPHRGGGGGCHHRHHPGCYHGNSDYEYATQQQHYGSSSGCGGGCRHNHHQKMGGYYGGGKPHPPHLPHHRMCECQGGMYSSIRMKKAMTPGGGCACKGCSPIHSRPSLLPLTINSDIPSTLPQLYFPHIGSFGKGSRERTRAYSSEAVLSSSASAPSLRASDEEPPHAPPPPAGYHSTKNAVTSPTIPTEAIQSDTVSTSTDNNNGPPNHFFEDNKTVSRATSPFVVKTAAHTVKPIPNDPAVKSLVKSVVIFNDVEYQVPTKIVRRSRSQEDITEDKENIYWEVEDQSMANAPTPLKPPTQQSCYRYKMQMVPVLCATPSGGGSSKSNMWASDEEPPHAPPPPAGYHSTKNAVTSPTIPTEAIQSDTVSTSTDNNNGPPNHFFEDNKTVSRATSPFVVKTAAHTVKPIPNDPAVKSLVKSVVIFNDVEYQVPTKIVRRSRSQEDITEDKENIYWEVEDQSMANAPTPLKPPTQQSCYSLFCTPRRKEGRNISADSVASVTPLLKGKKPSGLFRLSGWGNKNKQNSCLNSKLLRGRVTRNLPMPLRHLLEYHSTKNAVTSPTIPTEAIQSDTVSTSTDNNNGPPNHFFEDNKTVSRATSPFVVKTAAHTVKPIPNDPAVKSLVKSVVIFNDVEYQVPTKIVRRSRSQEDITEDKENIYWEVEDQSMANAPTPLKPPTQQSCYRYKMQMVPVLCATPSGGGSSKSNMCLFCTPRRKEGRNISADSVASVTPLLKGKKPSGLFRLSGWGNKNKQNSCLNSKLLRGMMSRKTADNLPQTSVRGTAPPPPPAVSRKGGGGAGLDKKGKGGKQSGIGKLFKRRSEGQNLRWKINPEYYAVRGEDGVTDYVLPDDTFESVEL